MLYRIFTENVNRKKIEGIVTERYIGYTIMNSTGMWKGQKEKSLVIEICTDKAEDAKVDWIAKAIKRENNQEAVLVQKIRDNIKFI